MNWRVFHKAVTDSTNRDARAGSPGDVFTADFQTAGRGRLGHRWLSPPGANLMMSAVVGVGGLEPGHAATLPLVAGLSVVEAVASLLGPSAPSVALKWPNDVLAGGRKIAGILCERGGDAVVVGIGVNVGERAFPREIAGRATSFALLAQRAPAVADVRDAVLARLAANVSRWRADGFAAVLPRIASVDFLKGREVSVLRTDADGAPARGLSGGIADDGSLLVAGERVYAGEAHVEGVGG